MILLTGGTGFVGQEVTKELLALGQSVRLLVRNPDRKNPFPHDPFVERVKGDVLKPETLASAMHGVQTVIHLIGIISETSKVTYEQAHIDATRHLLAAAKGAGVTRWIQMSAVGTRPHARSRYHQTKWHAEQLVRMSGLDWTIFRPSLIYGYDERDRLLNLLRRALSWPLDAMQLYSLPLINGGEALIQPVSVREVAHCFARAPAKTAAIGQTFDLVGPVAFSWREMIFKILAFLGKDGLHQEIPLLLILRKLLWLAVAVTPIVLIASWWNAALDPTVIEITWGFWAGFLVLAARWRTTLIYSLPGEALILASEPLNALAPRELCPGEVLKMAVEDNCGDPRPAAETFGYPPETFEEGLATCYAER